MANIKDPFYEKPLHKAYYHPTRQKRTKGSLKKSQISSPERKREISEREQQQRNEQFLKGSNKYKSGMPSDGMHKYDEKFDESWPESERPSTLSLPDADDFGSVISLDLGYGRRNQIQSDGPSHPDKPPTSKPRPIDPRQAKIVTDDRYEEPVRDKPTGKDSESTLSKYINRFRYGPALSKEDRERDRNSKDFWWLKEAPSDSSTPKEDSKTRSRIISKLTKSALEDRNKGSGQMYEDDDTLRDLNSRADQALEHAESSLNSSEPAVSTDGLGSSTLSNATTGTYSEQAYRPQFARSNKENIPNPLCSSKPEDDILYQWRLRRKMEVAKERLGGPSVSGTKHRHDPQAIDTKLTAFRRKLKLAAVDLSGADKTGMAAGAEQGQAGILRPQVETQRPQADSSRYSAVSSNNVDKKTEIGIQCSSENVKPVQASSENVKPVQNSVNMKAIERLTREVKLAEVAIQTSSEKLNQSNLSDCVDKTIQETHEHTPVASPCLKRRAGSKSVVQSHVHLSCDIIPCPKHKHSPMQKHLMHEDSDSSFERLKAKHMRALEAESRSASEQSDRNMGDKSRKVNKKSRKYKYVSSSSEDEIPVKDETHRKAEVVEKPEVVSDKPKKSAHRKEKANFENSGNSVAGIGADRDPHRDERTSNNDIKHPSNQRKAKSSNQRKERNVNDAEQPRARGKDTEQPRARGKDTEQPRARGRESFKERKPKVLEPQKHSSPKHPIQSTIGKVIGERLFAGSVASSIDPADGSYIGRHLVSSWEQQTQDVVHEEPTGSTDIELEGVILSDGEEFPDDEILLDLRKRRAFHMQQLHTLNGLLEQGSSS